MLPSLLPPTPLKTYILLSKNLFIQLAGLQEQLQGEKNSRATLEAGLPLSNLSSIDDKVNLNF